MPLLISHNENILIVIVTFIELWLSLYWVDATLHFITVDRPISTVHYGHCK